jgi:epoxyqueuosine reductase
MTVTKSIRDMAMAVGFDAVGFAPASLSISAREQLKEFILKGYHGDMGWLEKRMKQRSQPKELWEDAKSVVVLGLNYGPYGDPLETLKESKCGSISVYAQGRDYHDVAKKKLRILARFIADQYSGEVKIFVDTAPVMEKPLGARAGLGWQGKHTNLVSKKLGSWMFLAEIYTNLTLSYNEETHDLCGSCSRCLSVCPTKAFPSAYKLDATRCISYLTIEHKGHIPTEFREAIGNRIYGCDDCLAVCPWNKFASKTLELEFESRIELRWPDLADLVQLDDKAFRSLFSGSPIKRLGRDRFIRNVLIAIGNSQLDTLTPLVNEKLKEKSPLIRAMAIWALSKLEKPENFIKTWNKYRLMEKDKEVLLEWDRCLKGYYGRSTH